MILNYLFAFSLLTMAAFQFKSFYERSECVQDFQKESLKVITQKLLHSPTTHQTSFKSCGKPAFYLEKSHVQQTQFSLTNQKITLRLQGKLKR